MCSGRCLNGAVLGLGNSVLSNVPHPFYTHSFFANWLSSAKQQTVVVLMLGSSISWIHSRVTFALWYMCLFGDICDKIPYHIMCTHMAYTHIGGLLIVTIG